MKATNKPLVLGILISTLIHITVAYSVHLNSPHYVEKNLIPISMIKLKPKEKAKAPLRKLAERKIEKHKRKRKVKRVKTIKRIKTKPKEPKKILKPKKVKVVKKAPLQEPVIKPSNVKQKIITKDLACGKPTKGNSKGVPTQTDTNSNSSGKIGKGNGIASSNSETEAISDYLSQVISSIEKHKKYPYISRFNDEEGSVQLTFTILKNGEVSIIKVEKSSGYIHLDRAAVKAVKDSSPFPKPPNGKSTTLKVIIVFKLES